ncbi:NAD(P)H dehydrogenase (quinone) [Rhizobium sp. BK196]|jgi:NAD(P)H dehydrogenase (quinone)|uniref:NAD(P)H-dependent oxidoreductase n=1 Tax=Rhizobium sp. BK196 TaxID=2587073 RepID=UPI001618EC8D|nr:NAD(P)H-dependent oxidoreductase [Rhizobium sp. BK196]MBB3312898.1 NAD(P)H dehydrogenase (quinone) [Rhizobium sp. BK196]
MHALIVLAHPNSSSLSHSVAAGIAKGISAFDAANTFEIADLTEEGFDPRFSEADIAAHRRTADAPADVVAEQARIDRADALVLVFPVYWWSMPGLMKGWIDRVFANGWAYDDTSGSKVVKKLSHLRVHLIGIGGADAGTYERHGYFSAMKTQIDHGIFDYCGAHVVTSELLLDSDAGGACKHVEVAYRIGRGISNVRDHSATGSAA